MLNIVKWTESYEKEGYFILDMGVRENLTEKMIFDQIHKGS